MVQTFHLLAACCDMWEWLLFAAIVYLHARHSPWWCLPVSHLVIAGIIYIRDVTLIQAEMNKPGWDGAPDMDLIFALGVFSRIFFVNLVLLPISVFGYWRQRRQQKRWQSLRPALSGDLNRNKHNDEGWQ